MIRVGALRGLNISPRDSVNYMALEKHGIDAEMIGMFKEPVYDRTANRDEVFYCGTREIGEYTELDGDDYDIIDIVSLSNYLGSEAGAFLYDRVIPVIAENRPPQNSDKISKLIMQKYSHCICYTRDAYRHAELAGIQRKTQIYPSVNLDLFRPRDRPKDWDGLRVLFNAKPTWEKGFAVFVHALKCLPSIHGIVRANVPLEIKLPPNIEVIPERPYHELPELYQDVDVFVHPANDCYIPYWEQWGNVILEALSSGLYVVSTTNGTIPEVLSGADARIIPQRRIQTGLVETLSAIEKGAIDIGGARENNRALAEERYNPENNCARYADVVKLVMEG